MKFPSEKPGKPDRIKSIIKVLPFKSNRVELKQLSSNQINTTLMSSPTSLVICPQRPLQSPAFAVPTNALRFSSYIMLDFAKFFLPFPPIHLVFVTCLPDILAATLLSTPCCHPLLPTAHIVSHFQCSLPMPLATNASRSLLTFSRHAPSYHQTSNNNVRIRLRRKLVEWCFGDWLRKHCPVTTVLAGSPEV